MSRFRLILSLLLVAATAAGAASRGQGYGPGAHATIDVRDQATQEPLVGATVTVICGADTLRGATAKSRSGRSAEFACDRIFRDSVTLEVRYVGYRTFSRRYGAAGFSGYIDVGMETDAQQIARVIVLGEQVAMVFRGDTTIYNASAFRTLADDRLEELLRQLQKQRAGALEQAVAQYGAYVLAIIRNRSRGVLTPEDHEEIASDVFFALWNGAARIERGQLRPWLGAVARNRTAEAMRKQNVYLPLEDDTLITLDRLWEQMMEKERCAAIAQAMRALPDEDQEIFYRFYDLSQTAAQIAEDLHLNASTVRSRLMRGRRTLREALEKGGLFCENDVG